MPTCTRPGCAGSIEDGYCDTCGLAATSGNAASAPSARSAPSAWSSKSARSSRSSRSTRSTRSGSTRSVRTASRLLGGITLARPPLPPQDPLACLVAGEVPERKRFCSGCDSKLAREAGFCPKCGQEYSFKPTLKAGDLVAGKYEIKGTLAFGGLGWIYLALDTVLSRWVIMKGILNAKDPRMLEVAVKEREYLASVKHPSIVGIYDFITQGTDGFIVMEYVNGKTLMTLRKEHGGPLPPAEAISYIIEILPAFQYLDDEGLVYCDFKPENGMVEETGVKLIDLGAVRHIDDQGGDVYGSVGYSAPEASSAPSPLGDLYTVGRTLAVLVASFDFQGKYATSLPPPSEVPLFERYEPLYRFLLKATRAKPEERFQSASEMAEQLVGVLRHVVAGEGSGDVGHLESAAFESDSDRLGDGAIDVALASSTAHQGFPRLRVDREDVAANVILAAGALPDAERRLAMFERALKTHKDSLELKLRRVDELITMGSFSRAEQELGELQKAHASDWRLAWIRGRVLLAQGKTVETLKTFHAVLDELPGELAPQQALGRAYESSGELERAIHYYDAVSKADPSFASAALGLARCLEKKRDRAGAANAYRRVPTPSTRYAAAQMALARVLISRDLGEPTDDDLAGAAAAVEAASALSDGPEVHRLRADVFFRAAETLERAPLPTKSAAMFLGVARESATLRAAAEVELRACARFADTRAARIALVDEANRVRPQTWT